MSFSNNFTYLRKQAKLSQEEIAEQFDVSRQAVSKWETGGAYPEMDKQLAICDFFKVSLNDLLQSDLTKAPAPLPKDEEPAEETPEEEFSLVSHARIQGFINGFTFFFCVGFFFVCGLGFQKWHPTWIIFLLIPLVGCLSDCWGNKNKIKGGICGAIVFLSIIAYLLCGFYAHLWHIMWVVFLLIPVSGLLVAFIPDDK